MDSVKKKIGIGSISIVLIILGILFSISFGDRDPYGDYILRSLGLTPWSNGENGLHYTPFYSVIFFIPALILGYKFENDFGARLGKGLSLILIICTLILTPLFFIVS